MTRTVMADWSLLKRQPLLKRFKKTESVKAFIQASCGVTHLPDKIYKDINGAPMLFHTINMAKSARLIDDIVVLSPQKLPYLPEGIKDFVFQGEESDVLSRYHAAIVGHPCDYVVRLTSDCPLLDSHLIDYIIAASLGCDYGSNVLVPTFPDGMDIEVIRVETLRFLHANAKLPQDREHVTTLIRNRPDIQALLSLISVEAFKDQSYVKLSVDTEDDLNRVCAMEKAICQ